ncbi:MAG TPA: hypothetical protein VNZ49_05920 [Bacteroidia bacterium]|jgi:hypothetical protein|nr:hypothetical protein [Bacteroidia bacterium]
MGREKIHTVLAEGPLTEDEEISAHANPLPEKNNRDAHLEGLSEDEKKMIKLIANIFINFVVNGE